MHINAKEAFPTDLKLPFFQNGLTSGIPNYATCGPDSMYSAIESVLTTEAGEDWIKTQDRLILEAKRVLIRRLNNKWKVKHEDREDFWNLLCEKFPLDYACPKGTCNAAIDTSFQYIASLLPVSVVIELHCSLCQVKFGHRLYSVDFPIDIFVFSRQFH